jgi:flagellar hook-basal body complex protein FliE
MIVPAAGVGLESALTKVGGAAGPAGGAEPALPAVGAPAEGLSSGGIAPVAEGEPASFGGALTKAISSLEQSQQSAAGAAQGLALGTASDPESAVVTVEDAQLEMQLAAQIRTKATEAAQSIFQTQV